MRERKLTAISASLLLAAVLFALTWSTLAYSAQANPIAQQSADVSDVALPPASEVQTDVVHITIIHLNDIYEITAVSGGALGGVARVATLKKQLLAQNPNTFVTFSGDMYAPSGMSTAIDFDGDGQPFDGIQAVKAMNEVGINYMTFGDHEFNDFYGEAFTVAKDHFFRNLDQTEFPIVSSNVFSPGWLPFSTPNTTVKVNDTFTVTNRKGASATIGIFGVTKDIRGSDVRISQTNWISATETNVVSLTNEGADLILALTHQPLENDQVMSARFSDTIDLILGADDHDYTRSDLTSSPPVIKSDSNARNVYVIDLYYNTATESIVSITPTLTPITDEIPADPETQAVVDEWTQKAFDMFAREGYSPTEVLGQPTEDLDGFASTIRYTPTVLTRLIGDGYVNAADITATTAYSGHFSTYLAGNIRLDDKILAGGEVIYYDVIRGLPSTEELVTVAVPEALLLMLDPFPLFLPPTPDASAGTGGYKLFSSNVTYTQSREPQDSPPVPSLSPERLEAACKAYQEWLKTVGDDYDGREGCPASTDSGLATTWYIDGNPISATGTGTYLITTQKSFANSFVNFGAKLVKEHTINTRDAMANEIRRQYSDVTAQTDVVRITIIHLNDIYEITAVSGGALGGVARVATLKKQLLAQNPNTFVTFSGDMYAPSGMSTAIDFDGDGQPFDGIQAVKAMNEVGINYMTFGDHEFNDFYGEAFTVAKDHFFRNLDQTEFPIVSSNVFSPGWLPFSTPNTTVKVNDTFTVTNRKGASATIGIFGVTKDIRGSDVRISQTNWISATETNVVSLTNEGADLILALTHQPLEDDQVMSARFSDTIDLILGADDHDYTRSDLTSSPPVIKSDSNARNVYVVDLYYDTASQSIVGITPTLMAITDEIPADPETQSVVDEWTHKAFDMFAREGYSPTEVLGYPTEDLDGFASTIRYTPTVLTRLIGDGYVNAAKADLTATTAYSGHFGTYVAGNIRLDDKILAGGDVIYYDVIRGLPSTEPLATVAVTEALLLMIDNGFAPFLPPTPDVSAGTGRYKLFSSNVTYTQSREPQDSARAAPSLSAERLEAACKAYQEWLKTVVDDYDGSEGCPASTDSGLATTWYIDGTPISATGTGTYLITAQKTFADLFVAFGATLVKEHTINTRDAMADEIRTQYSDPTAVSFADFDAGTTQLPWWSAILMLTAAGLLVWRWRR